MQAPHFRVEHHPTLGTGVIEMRYDLGPMTTETEMPIPVDFRSASQVPEPVDVPEVLLELRILRGEMQSFQREVWDAHQEILAMLEAQTWSGRWRRLRQWVVSFFKE